jgi:hypothetical protein
MTAKIVSIATALALAISLSGCGGGALMALTAAGSAASIAKNVFDVDVDIHSLLNQPKPQRPIPPAAIVAQPQLLVTTPPGY